MISQKFQIEIKVNQNNHTYQCPLNITYEEVAQALAQMRAYALGQIALAEEANSKDKEKKSEEVPDGNK